MGTYEWCMCVCVSVSVSVCAGEVGRAGGEKCALRRVCAGRGGVRVGVHCVEVVWWWLVLVGVWRLGGLGGAGWVPWVGRGERYLVAEILFENGDRVGADS